MVYTYDTSLTARQMIGYIAEQAGGFACIDRYGRLCIKNIGTDDTEIDINLFEDYYWGEKFQCNEIDYNNEEEVYCVSDSIVNGAYLDTVLDSELYSNSNGTNIEIDANNLYIISEEQLRNIYNKLKELELYGFEGQTKIDPSIDIGDIIFIEEKPIVYQGDMEFTGKFKGYISSKIETKQKKNTTLGSALSYATKIRNLKGQVKVTQETVKEVQDDVIKKVDKDKVIKAINETDNKQEENTIKPEKLNINGIESVNGNFGVDEAGNMYCNNATINGSILVNDTVTINDKGIELPDGSSIIGASGVLSNLQFGSLDWKPMGYWAEVSGGFDGYSSIYIPVYIPENFVITEAYIILQHCPIRNARNNTIYWGYSRNIGLYYQNENTSNFCQYIEWDSEATIEEQKLTSEVIGAFGNGGWTPSVPSNTNYSLETKISSNIASYLQEEKVTLLQIRSRNSIPNWKSDIQDDNFSSTLVKQKGACRAVLNVIGYKSS